MLKKSVVGEKLGIPEMSYGPVEENGVIFLFGLLYKHLGFDCVEEVHKRFPDCIARKKIAQGKYQKVSIEFEYKSSDFVGHKHLEKMKKGIECDYIICWLDDWEDCPKEIKVISLRDYCNLSEKNIPEKFKHLASTEIDTLVCPAQKKGFKEAFIKKSRWWAVRILSSKADRIKFIAMYQVAPVSAITYLASVTKIEEIKKGKDKGKYMLYLKSKRKIKPIGLKNQPRKMSGLRGPIYTSKEKLEKAKDLDNLIYS